MQPSAACVGVSCKHDTSLRIQKLFFFKNNNNHSENSIKIKLGASDKSMEIKVLCKSDVCLPGHVPDHKGAALYCIQMSCLGKLSSSGKQAQKTILHKSLERTLHILERFSYFTHYTSTTAVKVINNPPLIFTHLRCICSKNALQNCIKTTPVMNSSFSISYCTQLSPRVKT